ncbi:leucyl/phenylalanyl-tRNA--protein transferase [Aurantiacibacter rhizosphaerae]|uniref:Leucyl/phenylalanyl-tRNA--protein transferase n=1 Tax=Aurantiacibacter rhizosphaerae TaxID=2691582 RepID=A0A844XGW8_9SPHN|nr:leucyl/phenylalanyl-tRNA--protein transferase [Aurantiacibacter rhizosphaerae]MWV28973.1 leucyl/phenylalanyl-tRNA--protein transferase [Aurantiacibacter rhizosphaerae]
MARRTIASDAIMQLCYARDMHAPSPKLIPPEVLLLAYRTGIFPMADSRDDDEVFWVEPRRRAILPLDGFHCSRSLAKLMKQDRYRITMDADFPAVVEACAQPRPDPDEGTSGTWISHAIAASYHNLHAQGHAHSVECWLDDRLVGGLYGVSFERVFCGESMFSRADNASKVALAWLVALMRRAGFMLLDCQFMTGHLASLGAVEITRDDYQEMLARACAAQPLCSLPQAIDLVNQAASSSSPGKLIAQSFTHTS